MIGLRLESRNDRNLISSSIDFLTSAAFTGLVMAKAGDEAVEFIRAIDFSTRHSTCWQRDKNSLYWDDSVWGGANRPWLALCWSWWATSEAVNCCWAQQSAHGSNTGSKSSDSGRGPVKSSRRLYCTGFLERGDLSTNHTRAMLKMPASFGTTRIRSVYSVKE